jgi:DNA-directed RNA polymerase specialized sigma subunit
MAVSITPTSISVAAPSPAVVWQQYRRTGDPRTRDRLIFTLAPLVRHAGAKTAQEAGAGLRALIAAVEAYSPAQDGPIESHAWTAVRAALAG